MFVLVAGAHGRLGERIVALLLSRGHKARCLVRTESHAEALRGIGAEAVVADLRGDVEWTANGCEATVFAAGARHRADLGAVDAGGAAKLAEAAYHYEHSRFVLCSVIGADRPGRRDGGVGEFLAAKHHAERRLTGLDMPWSILRFGRLTEAPGTGRISTDVSDGASLTLSRDDAALAVVGALERRHLAGLAVAVIDGDRTVSHALDSVIPRELPAPLLPAPDTEAPLAAAQADNPRDAPNMIEPDASPLDADVEWWGDGPVPREAV